MTTQTSFPKGIRHAAILLLTVCTPLFARAQFVADGQTEFLDGITTNIAETVTIGTNGSFTLLVVTNGSTVTITGNEAVLIGANISANSNALVVTGPGSVWSGDYFDVGGSGSFNQLSVLNGATVTGAGAIGNQANSSNNTILVSDPGSLWQSDGIEIGVGSGGVANNQLIVSNGATVAVSGNTYTGPSPGTANSSIVVTGPGSVFTNSGTLDVGGFGLNNMLLITNGGEVFSGSGGAIGSLTGPQPFATVITGAGSTWTCGDINFGYPSDKGMNQLSINNGGAFICTNAFNLALNDNSNLVTVADPGSSLKCQSLVVGAGGIGNQCVISNGARMAATSLATVEGTNTGISITDPGTVWTNTGPLHFGQYSNTLSILNGATLNDAAGYIYGNLGKPNTVIISGAHSLWYNAVATSAGDFHVADSGAQLLITNGGMLFDGNGYFGDASSGSPANNAFALIAGPGSAWTNVASFFVGYNGSSNEVLVTDSAKLISGGILLGLTGNANQMIVSNSAFVGAQAISIGGGASLSNILTIDGGTLAITNPASNGAGVNEGTVVLNSGLFMVTPIGVSPTGNILFNGGTLQSGSMSYRNTNPFMVGDGTDAAVYQTLGGIHSFTGGLIISSNALLIGSGTVAGSPTINGNISVNNGGTITVGTNIGMITMNSGLALNPGSTISMKVNASSGTCDTFTGLTNITYGGTLQLTDVAITPFHNGNSFKLFLAANYSGAFSAIVPTTPGTGLRWDTSELNVNGTLRVFSTPTPSPSFSSATTANGNLVFTATGGVPYDPCYLLSSTNLATPLSDWSHISTNYFDSTGAAAFTNSISLDQPQQFFEIQVN